jgi:hypothetical protein
MIDVTHLDTSTTVPTGPDVREIVTVGSAGPPVTRNGAGVYCTSLIPTPVRNSQSARTK